MRSQDEGPSGDGRGGASGAGEDRVVWVVDDSPAVQLLARCAFERAGWRVSTFDDLAAARAALAGCERAPKAVLLDIHLPDGNGLDHVESFAEAGSAVVMVSNVAGPDQLETAFGAGAADAIQKPFDLRSLVARVERSVNGAPGGAPAARTDPAQVSGPDATDLLSLHIEWA